MSNNHLKAATIGLALLAEVGCTTLPHDAPIPFLAEDNISTLMTDKKSERAEELDIDPSPLTTKYNAYDVISEEQLSTVIGNIKDSVLPILIETLPEQENAIKNAFKDFTPEMTSSIEATSTKLEGNLIDFKIAEAKFEKFFNDVESTINQELPESFTDISAKYKQAFPENTSQTFDLPDMSHLPDMSNDPKVQDIIAGYAKQGHEVKLATPDEYSTVLELVVDINERANTLNDTNHTPPIVFIAGSDVTQEAFYHRDIDIVVINDSKAVFSDGLEGTIAHELGHRQHELEGNHQTTGRDHITKEWKEDCNFIEEAAINSQWNENLKNNPHPNEVLTAFGDTAAKVKENLADKFFVGDSCAESVAQHFETGSKMMQQEELAADKFAVDVGMGKSLEEDFDRQAHFHDDIAPLADDKLSTHPSLGERVELLKGHLEDALGSDNPFNKIDEKSQTIEHAGAHQLGGPNKTPLNDDKANSTSINR